MPGLRSGNDAPPDSSLGELRVADSRAGLRWVDTICLTRICLWRIIDVWQTSSDPAGRADFCSLLAGAQTMKKWSEIKARKMSPERIARVRTEAAEELRALFEADLDR